MICTLFTGETSKEGYFYALLTRIKNKMYWIISIRQITRSTYYFEINKVDAVRYRNERSILVIKEIFEYNKGRHGVRRVYKELVNRGHNVNHK